MQERYLGDSHDFLKYALLRHLNRELDVRLGVNWYLTLPDQVDRPGNNDGEKRHHLRGGVWEKADAGLLEHLRGFEQPDNRVLANVANWGVLPPDTLYYDDPVAVTGRQEWHRRGLSTLVDAGLVFLDPDNGFEVKSTSARTRPKYAEYGELAGYVDRGQIVVAIQFARQCDPIFRAIDVRDRLIALHGGAAALPVVRGRVAPNILFFTLAPPSSVGRIKVALGKFVQTCGKAELIA